MKTLIIRRVPEELHRAFKTRCAAEAVQMTAKIIELLRLYVAGLPKAKKY